MDIRKKLVAGALALCVFGGVGVAYAAWQAAASKGAGSTKAAKVAVAVDGGTLGGSNCSNLLPGESCSASFTATNTGTVSETFAAAAMETDPDDCWETTASIAAGIAELGDAHDDYDPGQSETGTVTSTLRADAPSSCMDHQNDVTVQVTASVSPSPRD